MRTGLSFATTLSLTATCLFADSNRPQTWFHLIGGNVSKEGIVRDLDAIAAAGIGGIQFFHGQFGGAWPHVDEQIPCLSGKWDDIVRFTATEAKRRGLSFTLQNCPGWSYAGGPWVPVERSMRVLDATRTDVRGGAVDAVLPKPAYPACKDDKRTDFRDLKVIAFPKLAGEAAAVRPVDFKPVHFADTNSPVVLRYDLGREMTVRSVVFDNPRQMCWCWQSNPVQRIELFAETAAGEAKVGDWRLPMMSWQDAQPLTLPIRATTFRWCRFRFTYKSALHLDGISFLGEARYRSWESEAGYSHRELMKGDEPASAAGEAVDPKTVIDLTEKMEASSGRLVATLPAGEWTVLRIGHASNGHTNAPAPEEATGFECDKLSPEAARRHFTAYTGRLAAKGGPLDGRLDGVLVDSWECGFQNWTADGLDVRTADWPALFGYVVGDRAATRAFYRGWRNRLSARVNAGFYRTTADLIRSVGGKFWCEVGPGEVFPGDPMEYFKHADVPMCEFWLPFAKADEQVFDRPNERYSAACVSAAHVYGKRRVAAESFTSCVTWNEDFKLMKETMDAFFSLGVTYPVFHTYTHNPATDLPPPGTSFGEGAFGCPFLRGQTWWPYMRHFTDYLTRCTALLERGVPANDVLMYLGDDVNALPRTSEDGTWEHPAGFAVDYLNRDALMNRLAFRDGRVVSPEGAAWRAIWIPEGTCLSPATERRLAEAERARVPVKRGSGSVAAFLERKGLQRDFTDASGRLRYIHRKDGAKDIYFVCVNRKDGGFAGPVGFGAKGKAAVYDPVRDTRTAWDGRTLTLAPGGSAFVIFGEDGADGVSGGRVLSVDEIKSWTLSFPAGWGAPENLSVEKLVPWCELPVPDEAKAFSGTVVYRTTFRGRLYEKLDLGRVETIAEVKVNGKVAGVLWCEPYAVDIGELCTDGENELEIAVTSTWHNRLWYDGLQPEANRKTWTLPYPKNLSAGRLLPYGLIGANRRTARPVVTGAKNRFTFISSLVREPVRFFVAGDTHMTVNDARGRPYLKYTRRMGGAQEYGKVERESFERTLKEAREANVDLLALVGDQMSFPSWAGVEYMTNALALAGVPWLYTNGNHDWHFEGLPGSERDLRAKYTREILAPLFAAGEDSLCFTRVVKGVRFVAIDNSTHEILPEQLAYWRREVATGEPIVLLMHIPLYVPGFTLSEGACGHPQWNAAHDPYWRVERRPRWPEQGPSPTTLAFRDEVFAAPNLIGVFTGHVHEQQFATDTTGAVQLSCDRNGWNAQRLEVRLLPTTPEEPAPKVLPPPPEWQTREDVISE